MLFVDLFQDGELEHVHQLVMDHVAKFSEGSRVGEDDSALREFGEPLHALGKGIRAHVGLLEMLMRGVDDQGNRVRDLVLELTLQVLIAVLREGKRRAGERLLFRIIEDLHVIAAKRQPLKRVVVHLVFPERKRLGVRERRRESNGGRDREETGEELNLLHSGAASE